MKYRITMSERWPWYDFTVARDNDSDYEKRRPTIEFSQEEMDQYCEAMRVVDNFQQRMELAHR